MEKQKQTDDVQLVFHALGLYKTLPESTKTKKNFIADLIRSIINVEKVEHGRIVCSLTVTDAVTNLFGSLHGGAVTAVAEVVAVACMKTVAGEKVFFLGESSTAYLAAGKLEDTLEVEGCILRKGRRVIVTTVDFRIKKTGKLCYTHRATYYVMPSASL